ncbi:MAG: hypothetical protein WBA51_06085 [Erythrobacter sp.]
MVGTLFERTQVNLHRWFYAMLYFSNSLEGISSRFLSRQIGVSEPTGFRIGTRIRYHLAAIEDGKRLGSEERPVIARLQTVRRVINPEFGTHNKANVLMMSDGCRVDSTIIEYPDQTKLRAALKLKVVPGAPVFTDCYHTYAVGSKYGHLRPLLKMIPRPIDQVEVSRSLLHGFMGNFLLTFADQFRGVQLARLWLYLKEFEFRFNRRSHSNTIFWDMTSTFPSCSSEAIHAMKVRHHLAKHSETFS